MVYQSDAPVRSQDRDIYPLRSIPTSASAYSSDHHTSPFVRLHASPIVTLSTRLGIMQIHILDRTFQVTFQVPFQVHRTLTLPSTGSQLSPFQPFQLTKDITSFATAPLVGLFNSIPGLAAALSSSDSNARTRRSKLSIFSACSMITESRFCDVS